MKRFVTLVVPSMLVAVVLCCAWIPMPDQLSDCEKYYPSLAAGDVHVDVHEGFTWPWTWPSCPAVDDSRDPIPSICVVGGRFFGLLEAVFPLSFSRDLTQHFVVLLSGAESGPSRCLQYYRVGRPLPSMSSVLKFYASLMTFASLIVFCWKIVQGVVCTTVQGISFMFRLLKALPRCLSPVPAQAPPPAQDLTPAQAPPQNEIPTTPTPVEEPREKTWEMTTEPYFTVNHS